GNAANEGGEIGVNSLFNYVKNNINEYQELKKHPVSTEVVGNAAKGMLPFPTKQAQKFPLDVFQKPRKIDSTQEVDLIIGLVPPSHNRQALIIDQLSSSLVDIEFCKILQDRGGFAVEHCFLEDKIQENLAERITSYLQNKANETVLLYLAGEVIQSQNSEYSLAINQENKINLNWLGQQLRDLPFKEAIIIVDVLEQHQKHPEIRDILNPNENKSLCLIAASSKKANKRLSNQIVEILSEAAEEEAQLWAATLITKLQQKADFPPELSWQKLGLYSSSTAIDILLPKSRRTNNQIYDLNINPYKSLQAFTQNDAYFFHGRVTLIDEIIEKLESTSFLAVVGASGSGKSSVVRAGIVPQLIAEGLYSPQYDEYLSCQTFVMRPGDDPLTALATALNSNHPELAEGLLHIGADFFISWLQQQPQEVSVLIIDQFEELFTTEKKALSNDFIQLIVEAVDKAHSIFKVIITLRNDFLDDCLANQNIDPLFRHSHVLVPSYLTEAEYRQILNQPAQKVGLAIEEELVNVLLQELQQDSLPLLQFALNELWQKRIPGTLTLANYQENVGGLGAILGKKAEETLDKLNSQQQECAQSIFQDLVQLGEGKEDTRRRISREKLKKTKHEAVFDSTLKELVAARLLVIDSDTNNTLAATSSPTEENQPSKSQNTVEIAHEILIRNWKTLRSWLNTNRTQIRLGRELEQKAEEWVNTPKDRKYKFLLPEAGLIKYQDLYSDRINELNEEVKQFIKLSQEKCDRLKQEEEARRNRELKQERKARINAQRFAWTLGIGLIASLGLSGLAGWQWHKSRINEINSLINTAEALLASNQEFDALITGLEAGKLIENTIFRVDPKTKIRVVGELQNIFYHIKESNRLDGYLTEFSPDGKIIATANNDSTVKLWNLRGKLLHTLKSDGSLIYGISFDPSNEIIATASMNGKIDFWNLEGKSIKNLQGHKYIVKTTTNSPKIAFTPDGKYFIHSGLDGEIKIYNREGELHNKFKVSDHPLSKVKGYSPIIKFTSDSQTFVTNSLDNTFKLWTIEGDLRQTFKGHTGIIKSIAISPDNKIIASATYDGEPKLWNLEGRFLGDITAHKRANEVFFIPYGEGILITSYTGGIKFWNSQGKLLQTINGFINFNTNILLSSDNKTLAFSQGNEIRILDLEYISLWNVQPRFFNSLQSHNNTIKDIDFHPDGKTITSVGENYGVRIWNLENTPLNRFQNFKYPDYPISSIAFDSDGEIIVSGSGDGQIKIWDANGNLLNTFQGHKETKKGTQVRSAIHSINISPNGKIIASVSRDQTVKLWNLKGELIRTLENYEGWYKSVAFSPDGKTIISGGGDKIINFYNYNGNLLKSINSSGNIHSLIFSPNGKTIISGGGEGIIQIWTFEGRLQKILKNNTQSSINNLAFSPDGKKFASANINGQINIWSVKGKLIQSFNGHIKSINSIKFTPGGKFIASASSDGTVKLWNLKGKLIQNFKVHSRSVNDVVFHPDKPTFVSSSSDISVKFLSLDLDEVMTRGCDWVQDYLTNNSNVSEEDRKICDRYYSK
ncbi:MAG: hypothetical protein AAFN00_15000, partial [Cyanobacteria bacterium J06558_2]